MTKPDGTLQTEITAAVAEGFAAQIALTQDLIRHPSVRGREQTGQDFLADRYRERGYGLDRWALQVEEIARHPGFSPVTIDYENSFNLVATHRPREDKGRSLILNGHVDVVPVGPLDMWTHPPFDPVIEGDWLYGRGSGDMKAGLVLNLAALDALRRLGYQPAARVHLQSVVEEECTGNGALAALLRGYKADAAIITEPTNHALVRANLGVIWLRVHLRGKPVHVLEAGSGANAIEMERDLVGPNGNGGWRDRNDNPVEDHLFIFEFDIETSIEVGCDPASSHYQGPYAKMGASYFGSGIGSGLHLEVTDGPVGEFGFLLVSATANGAQPLSNGTLCLDLPLGRYNSQVAGHQNRPALNSLGMFDASGRLQLLSGTPSASTGFDVPSELPFTPPGQVIVPGSTWVFQAWFRDQNVVPGDASNLSNTLEVTF